MANRINVDVTGEEEVLKMLQALDAKTFYQVTDRAIRKASRVVQKRAKQLAPRSSETGSSAKRAKAQREQYDWDTPLHTTIAVKVVKGKTGAVGVVGPSWPKGNKAFFNNAKNGRRVVFWGRKQGTIYRQEDWLKRALDESANQARDIIFDEVKSSVMEVQRG